VKKFITMGTNLKEVFERFLDGEEKIFGYNALAEKSRETFLEAVHETREPFKVSGRQRIKSCKKDERWEGPLKMQKSSRKDSFHS